MRYLGGKRWKKLWIEWNWPFWVNLSLILGEKIENPVKWLNLAILTQSKPLFRPNLELWVILSHIGVKRFEKVGKLKKVADVPSPQEWKSWIQVKVTFWFWLMYPPPPRNWNWTKHECYRKKIISREVIKYILPIYPPFHYHYLILCLNRKMVNFNFKWIYRLEPHPPPLSSQKNKMLIFGLCSASDDQLGWLMDSNPSATPL